MSSKLRTTNKRTSSIDRGDKTVSTDSSHDAHAKVGVCMDDTGDSGGRPSKDRPRGDRGGLARSFLDAEGGDDTGDDMVKGWEAAWVKDCAI